MHVRVDAPGTPLVDDQTIQGNPNASPTRQTIQSKRTYLCDASFVAVVVPGPHGSLQAIAEALVRPVFAPFLGRRACVPSSPLLLAPEDEATLVRDVRVDGVTLDTCTFGDPADRRPCGPNARVEVDRCLDDPLTRLRLSPRTFLQLVFPIHCTEVYRES